MNYELFSEAWVKQVEKEMKYGPCEERKKNVQQSYWKWIHKCKQDVNIQLALELRKEGDERSYAFFEICNGEVIGSRFGENDDGQVDFILSGAERDWLGVIVGRRDMSLSIISQTIKLRKGNMHFFLRRIYFFIELLLCLRRVPIKNNFLIGRGDCPCQIQVQRLLD